MAIPAGAPAVSRVIAAPIADSSFAPFAAMLALAGLDFIGAIFAKEWVEHQSRWLFVGGVAIFCLLFMVYAASLEVAELSTVTLGWMVCLQVGLLLIERFRYGVTLPSGKWIAVAAILVLQTYLVLAPNDG